jgi:hypothetical protein
VLNAPLSSSCFTSSCFISYLSFAFTFALGFDFTFGFTSFCFTSSTGWTVLSGLVSVGVSTLASQSLQFEQSYYISIYKLFYNLFKKE